MVFVDNARIPFGRMLMCHMVADTRAELDAMADRIGVNRRWIQHAGQVTEHYDVSLSSRARAIELGAKRISTHDLGLFLRARRLERAAAAAAIPAGPPPAVPSMPAPTGGAHP